MVAPKTGAMLPEPRPEIQPEPQPESQPESQPETQLEVATPVAAIAPLRLLLLCGGQSEEHEVSLASAKSVMQALAGQDFAVTPQVITRAGRWLPPAEAQAALAAGSASSGGELVLHQASQAEQFDVVFPLLHGPMGEDGTIQGLLTLAGLPFVGSGVLGSAVSMDKVMTKSVLAAHGIPQVPYKLVLRGHYRHNPDAVLDELAELGLPLFVKPANLGSSVGISKAKDPETLKTALDTAFFYDRRVIVEAAAGSNNTGTKPRELEVGILGNDHPMASPVGELTFETEFYDYDTKYIEGRAAIHIPAQVPAVVAEQIRQLALQAFAALDCAGLARIDFFYLPESNQIYLNEVNTMPGFTKTSMYPSLMQAAGWSYEALVARLVALALERR
jgi:D-alanine-D-alanine ligase